MINRSFIPFSVGITAWVYKSAKDSIGNVLASVGPNLFIGIGGVAKAIPEEIKGQHGNNDRHRRQQ